MAKYSESRQDNENAGQFLSNRRERRGNKSGAHSGRGATPAIGRASIMVANPRQYAIRRRGG